MKHFSCLSHRSHFALYADHMKRCLFYLWLLQAMALARKYTFTKDMDVQDAVPFDTEALLTAAQQGVEINEAEGWVRNVNQTDICS
jgi:hypothetical protein